MVLPKVAQIWLLSHVKLFSAINPIISNWTRCRQYGFNLWNKLWIHRPLGQLNMLSSMEVSCHLITVLGRSRTLLGTCWYHLHSSLMKVAYITITTIISSKIKWSSHRVPHRKQTNWNFWHRLIIILTIARLRRAALSAFTMASSQAFWTSRKITRTRTEPPTGVNQIAWSASSTTKTALAASNSNSRWSRE